MLNSISRVKGTPVRARDGDMGQVTQAYFDDRDWTIRYLVINTGNWLSKREVLISPSAVQQRLRGDHRLHLSLTQAQVRNRPLVNPHGATSRQPGCIPPRYCEYSADRDDQSDDDSHWGMGAVPYPSRGTKTQAGLEITHGRLDRDFRPDDVHLRSSAHVKGYKIQARDECVGKVHDFVFDEDSWTLRYLVVDTRHWWPGGRKVLVNMHWADQIDWATQTCHLRLKRAQIVASPTYADLALIQHRREQQQQHERDQNAGDWIWTPP